MEPTAAVLGMIAILNCNSSYSFPIVNGACFWLHPLGTCLFKWAVRDLVLSVRHFGPQKVQSGWYLSWRRWSKCQQLGRWICLWCCCIRLLRSLPRCRTRCRAAEQMVPASVCRSENFSCPWSPLIKSFAAEFCLNVEWPNWSVWIRLDVHLLCLDQRICSRTSSFFLALWTKSWILFHHECSHFVHTCRPDVPSGLRSSKLPMPHVFGCSAGNQNQRMTWEGHHH